MVSISKCLIQAIVGKGLYEQYTKRQIAGEVLTRTDLARSQEHDKAAETQRLHYSLLSGASPTSSTGRDATNTPRTEISTPTSTSAIPSPRSRPSSSTVLGPSLRPRPTKSVLMPEYKVVHNHCPRTTEDLESDDSTIMQSYEYGPLDIGPPIGFQAPPTHQRIHAPARKVTTLESLPPLSAEVAAEIARRVKVREQAEILAVIREVDEQESERQRRANRATHMRLPPYVAHMPTASSIADHEAVLSSQPQPTLLTRPKYKQFQTEPNQPLRQAGPYNNNVHKQVHVRWAPEPLSQRRRRSTAPYKKVHHGK